MANAQLQVEFLDNNRGGFFLIHNGYKFSVKSHRDERCYWRCVNRQCSARITTVDNVPVSVGRDHTHPSDIVGITAAAFISGVKKRCRDEVDPIPSIFDECLGSLRDRECDVHVVSVIESIPTFESVKSALYRSRAKVIPKLPATQQDINLEHQWTETLAGDRFVLCDDTDNSGNRIIIFATDDNLQRLCDAAAVYGDGTFYSCPGMFTQLYTLHASVHEQMFPLVFCLLPNKSELTYQRMFSLLQEAVRQRIQLELTPETVMLDFEVAARNAVRAAFPQSRLRGCYFHYTQCIWRKTQACGLAIAYRDEEDIKRLVRRAAVLPLVPVHEVEDVWFNALEDIDDDRAAVTRFCDYVTETWVETDRTESNHFDNTGARTTNHVEGWHSKMNKICKRSHPNIYVLVQMLQKEQATNEAKMIQLSAGGKPRSKRRKYRNLDSQLQHLKDRFRAGQLDVVQYADAASHLIHLE